MESASCASCLDVVHDAVDIMHAVLLCVMHGVCCSAAHAVIAAAIQWRMLVCITSGLCPVCPADLQLNGLKMGLQLLSFAQRASL